MSDEPAELKPKARRGRPPKKRHDPEDAPVTGSHTDEKIFNREPGYEYMWASDEDMPKLLNRGAEVCKRDSEQARPYYDNGKNAGEADFKFKGLTLMKITTELHAKDQAQGLAIAKQRMSALRRQATSQIGNGQFASISQLEYGRQAI